MVTHIISIFRVFKASVGKDMYRYVLQDLFRSTQIGCPRLIILYSLTFDGNYQLRNHWIDLLASVIDQVVASLASICLVGMLGLT